METLTDRQTDRQTDRPGDETERKVERGRPEREKVRESESQSARALEKEHSAMELGLARNRVAGPGCVERTSPPGGRRGAQRAQGARGLDLSGVLRTGVHAKWVATGIQAHGDDFPGGWPKRCPSFSRKKTARRPGAAASAGVCGTRCALPAPRPGLDAWGGAG
ncbi:hypothetical protein P7K49_035530 [Saguinus oedipus]|uniref:Uncharacterized protein n=1 Tax=Saguinus oedipus TaxID=9490 RepID=A0ABQ9TMV8_SAGOE|nr:hypothetical protein P7K49_035530 [Saguinus oedipus]